PIQSNTTINLNWTASTDAAGIANYEVYQDGTKIGTTSNTHFTAVGLESNTTHSFYVKAVDTDSEVSEASETITASTINRNEKEVAEGEDTVYLIGTVPSNNQVEKNASAGSWRSFETANLEESVVIEIPIPEEEGMYKIVYRMATGPDMGTVQFDLGRLGPPKYSIDFYQSNPGFKEFEEGWTILPTKYGEYKKRLTVKGKHESSTGYKMGIDAVYYIKDTVKPTTPSTLSLVNKTMTSVKLTWSAATDNARLKEYEILSGTTVLGTVDAYTTSYTAEGLTPNAAYNFIVRAKDYSGNLSDPTEALVVKTGLPPTKPTGLTSPIQSNTTINLNWTASTDAAGIANYEVYQDGTKIGTTSNTHFTAVGLESNTTHSFYVKAVDTDSEVSE
ncbi:fibronectin type III domain-containing protein, partial [Paenibacillus oenotherae]